MHFSFPQKQRVINGQRFERRFLLHLPFHPCWTILVPGHISQVKWTGVRPIALRPGVIVFAPFQIWHFQRIFELPIIGFPFRVSNEICDDRRQERCGLIRTGHCIVPNFRLHRELRKRPCLLLIPFLFLSRFLCFSSSSLRPPFSLSPSWASHN